MSIYNTEHTDRDRVACQRRASRRVTAPAASPRRPAQVITQPAQLTHTRNSIYLITSIKLIPCNTF